MLRAIPLTERALCAIEETGRAALEDLERVLGVLRESGPPPSQWPTLAEADRLLESARASGSAVDAQLTGELAKLPGPVTREGYRILQESLTNVLRHCGPVPVRVRVEMTSAGLDLEVTNPLPERPGVTPGGGSGLRGIRERAALLGGEAETGLYEGLEGARPAAAGANTLTGCRLPYCSSTTNPWYARVCAPSWMPSPTSKWWVRQPTAPP